MTTDGSNAAIAGRPVRESQIFMARQMMPADTNPWGFVHGGIIMKMVDEAAGSAAIRHSHMRVATAAVDYMSFLNPVHVGDLVSLMASVNHVGRTSMEVGVRVETENMLTGQVCHTSSAYLVMVALDENGIPQAVPPVVAETPDQKRRMAAAQIRRAQRKILQAAIKKSERESGLPPSPVAPEMVQAGQE